MPVTFEKQAVPAAGQIAKVRQRLYLVDEVVSPINREDCTLVRMSCLDDDNQGRPLDVLWERELDAQIISAEDWDSIASRGFDNPRIFAAFFNTLRWNCVTATDPRLFQSPFRSGIRLDAYQLEPLRKALLLPRVNLFIADDVGLGKTIEAGLIARELLLRKKAREIVVSCPPSMLYQWKEELENRFGLTFEILDKDYMTKVRRERGFGINPWTTHTRFLISHRLLIDENYVGPMRDWLGTFHPGALLILDEAHNAAPASGQKYAIDSQLTRSVRDLAPRFEHRLFLSATPHNGHSNSFSALLEILDPQRFCRGVSVKPKMLESVLVRRLKDDLREIVGGFAKRVVTEITISGLPEDAPELSLAILLDKYRSLRETRLRDENKRIQAAAGLLVTGLQQRMLSSIEAFARTLHIHRKTVKRQWEEYQQKAESKAICLPSLDLISGGLSNDDEKVALSENELQQEEDAQFEGASSATMGPIHNADAQTIFAQEQELLNEMHSIAEASRGRPDARVTKIIDWIKEHMCPELGKPGASYTNIRAIIFTEYDDTRRYLQQQLQAAIAGSDKADQRIKVYFGQTPQTEREEIKHAFNADPKKHPVRILLATDAAREGLNLQAHCWNLFHFDVPWNPSRMEQRNGRIDRKLQPNAEVFCHYFVYEQRPEDRILAALVRKTETIKKELGSLSQVIDSRLQKRLEQGIRRTTIAELELEIVNTNLEQEQCISIADELENVRKRKSELKLEIDRLQKLLDESRKSIGLNKDHFRAAISAALELLNAGPLRSCSVKDPLDGTEQFEFPSLDKRDGADPTWSGTIDTLRTPKSREEKPWDWRRNAIIRPVVFEEPNTLNEDVVHLHLEHRVVQRLLSRFSSQGFIHHDLSRACLSQATDSIPRVVLLGRLCLYGPGAARLHEELIPITARWLEPINRKQPLTPYAKEAEAKTLELLEQSLLYTPSRKIPADVSAQLQKSATLDIKQLLEHLENRGQEYAAEAQRKLAQRADAESKAMREILESQKRHIASTLAQHEKDGPVQLKIKFAIEEEAHQVEANKRYWVRRLEMLDRELDSEPERVRQVYEIRAKRIEPIGLVYLWPASE